MKRLIDWIRHSGASVTILTNPCHWYWAPKIFVTKGDEWSGPNFDCVMINFLAVSVKVWRDDGTW